MPNTKSAKKRMRQNEKRRMRNKTIKSAVKTYIKKYFKHLESGEVEQAKTLLPQVVSKLDKSWQKGVYHKNYVGRKKSSLYRKLNAVSEALAK